MSDIRLVLLCNNGAYSFLMFYMLLAHIVDYSVCNIYLFPLLIRKILHLIQPSFVKLIRNKYTDTFYDLSNPP